MTKSKFNPAVINWDKPIRNGEFAALVGISSPRVSELITAGSIDKSLPAKDTLVQYCAHLREKAGGRSGESGLAHERAELTRVQREIAEIQLATKRGEFAPVALMAAQLSKIVSNITTQLVAIPRTLQKHHPDITIDQLNRIQAVVSAACELAVAKAQEAIPDEDDEEEAG